MSLAKGSVAVKLGQGIDTKSVPEGVVVTKLLALENGVFTRAGSIRKRNGYTALSSHVDGGDDASGFIRLASRDDELIAFTSNASFSNEPNADHWAEISGGVFSVVGTDRAAARTGTEQTAPDQATNNGVSVFAWEDSRGGVWYSVVDDQGHIHRGPVQADASGISPRCVAVGDSLHVYYAVQAQGMIYVVVVNPAAPSAAVSPVMLTDDLNTTSPVFDACQTTRTDTPAFIAWHERGTANLRLAYVVSGGMLGTPLNGQPSTFTDPDVVLGSTTPIAVAFQEEDYVVAGAGTLFIAFVGATTGQLRRLAGGDAASGAFIGDDDNSLTNVYGAPVSVQRIALGVRLVGASTESTAWIAFEEAAAAPSNRFTVVNSIVTSPLTSTVDVGTAQTIRSVGLATRAWAIGDDVFAYFVHDTTYFNVYLALRLSGYETVSYAGSSDFVCVARTLPGRAADAPARAHLPSAHVADDVVRIALPYNERVASENSDEFTETGIRIVTLDFDHNGSHQHAQLGRGLYLGGACPQHYDGQRWTEQGFHVGPEVITTANGSSGSLTAAGTYLYRAWYESTDAQGEIHRGPVSFGTLVTLGGGEDEVTLTLPALRVTKRRNVRLMVARSRAAETGKTAELFLVSSRDPTAAGANGYIENDPTVDTVTFNDRMSDAVLETQEPIYTEGGLSTDPAPLGHLIAEGKGRLFFNDPSDPLAVRYSQPIEDGYAAEVPPEFVIPVPATGGAITALAVGEDGTVLVFKREAIFAFGGMGPSTTGDTAAQGFSDPVRLRSPVGCDEPATIATATAATLFKSQQGIWQVDGAGQVTYVGAPAEAYNEQTITAATPIPGRTHIVFLTSSGSTLMYDYFFGQWGIYTNHEGYDAAVVGNTYHYLRTDGRVFREDVGGYSDAGVRIRLRLETAWIHLAEALQGLQRIWNVLVLGTWLSPHQLSVAHRTDYAPGQLPTSEPTAWSDPVYLDATGEAAGATGWITGDDTDVIGEDPILGDSYGDGAYGDGPYGGEGADVYQWRYHVGERGQSLQLRFEDYERVGLTGASFELTEILIEGGVAGPAKKPFSGARSG